MTLTFINKLHNQRVLILGGSTGIGFAVAEAAVEHGANMIISSSNQNKLDRAVKRLEEHIATANLPARHVSGKTCDRSSSETMEDIIKSLFQFATEAGKIDHVVFTAGDAVKPPSLDVSADDVAKIGIDAKRHHHAYSGNSRGDGRGVFIPNEEYFFHRHNCDGRRWKIGGR